MQNHSPNPDEEPTLFADLTIETVPLPPDDAPADEEQPSPLAECTVETVPLPPWDALADRTGQVPGGAP
jgi:hypothetical protein